MTLSLNISGDEWAPVRSQTSGPVERAHLDQVRFEQVRSLYKNCPFGTTAASVVALALALILGDQGHVLGSLPKPLVWSLIVCACCVTHIGICVTFWRARSPELRWRRWLALFTLMAFLEGMAWCLGAAWLLSSSDFTESIVILLAWAGVTSAGVSVFGVYPPTFIAFFYPAMIPHLVFALTARPPYYILLATLEVTFLIALPVIAFGYSGQMTQAYRLQFVNRDLAEAYRIQKDLAEQANLAKSKFLAAASHDLRQPVHALALFLAALQDRKLDPETRQISERMGTSIVALSELFSALLDISKLDAGAVTPAFGPFRVDAILRRVANDLAPEAQAKGVALRVVESKLAVRSDPFLVEQVLRNLVSNAVKYTERGGVVIGCRRSRRHVRFEIWDSGRGIAEADLSNIFLEFYQVDNFERDRAKGLGLGLAIVKRTAELIGAEIAVRSEMGRGSMFSMQMDRAAERAVVAAPASPPLNGASGKILVIEDEPEVLAAMGTLLSGWGHQVLMAHGSMEATKAREKCSDAPDLIISDYRLPNENGAEAIRRVRDYYKREIPAMLITGDTSPERIAEASESGLLVLHKPVVKSRLRAAVGSFLRVRAEGY